MFALVEERFGVRGRWMRRGDDSSTFMEVYEGVQDPPAFERLLEAEARTIAAVPRRMERFVSA